MMMIVIMIIIASYTEDVAGGRGLALRLPTSFITQHKNAKYTPF